MTRGTHRQSTDAVSDRTPFLEQASTVGIVLALTISALGEAVAMAALIFAGPLQVGLFRASSNFMLAAAIGIALIGWRSKLVPVMSMAQDGPAVVMVAVAASLAAGASASPATDVLIAVGLVTVVSAVVMALVGHFGLGSIVRFLPTTVVSGFVAGTGWLLSKGGFDVMMSRNLGVSDLGFLAGLAQLKFWFPGLLLSVAILVSGRYKRVPRVVTSFLPLFSVALFFVVVGALSSIGSVEGDGWLVGPFPEGNGLQLLSPGEIADADWDGLASNLPGMLVAVAVAVLSLLLNLSGLETMTRTRVDLEHETTTAGFTNLLVSPLGGIVGFHALGSSTLARQLGANSRIIPVGSGLLAAAFALIGGRLVGFIPRFVVGGLLLTVGLGLLVKWVEELRRTTSWSRRLFGIVIVAVIASVGILEGIAVGTILAIAIFVYQYSRVDPVRLAGTGQQFRSRVDRPVTGAAVLESQRDRLTAYRLQGYLFFGSLTQLAEPIRTRLRIAEPPLTVVVIDFHHVSGVDWSGLALLAQLGEEIESAGAMLILCGLQNNLVSELERSEPEFVGKVLRVETLDQALELGEAQIIAKAQISGNREAQSDSSPGLSEKLLAKFERTSVEAGTSIVSQGDPSDSFYIVLDGELSAFRTDEGGVRQRLRRFGSKTTIGELGLLTGESRSADVVAETECDLLVMSLGDYKWLRTSHPELALELHDYIMQGQASRIVTLSDYLAQALR